MKDLAIWTATISLVIAAVAALIPAIPFIIAAVCIGVVWYTAAKLVVFLFDLDRK